MPLSLKIILVVLVFGALYPYSAASLYSPKDDVITSLAKENFAKTVFGTPNLWLIEFYSTGCGHCQRFAPEFKKVATSLKGLIYVAAINVEEHKELAGFFQIKALPTIKLFPSDLTKSSGKEGEFYKQPVDYEGPRSASSLASWAISQLPNYVAILSDSKNAKPFFEQPPFPKVLLFTEKDEVSPLLKSLAIDFKYRLSFGQVKSTETALVARYEVQKIPTLLLATEDKVTAVYDGKLKHDPIFEWLSPHAPPQPPGASQSTSQPKQKPPEKRTPEVVQITDQKVMDSKCPRGLCMLFFLDPTETEDHNRYLELLTSLSKKYLSSFRIMWVDVTKKPNFVSQFDLASGFPQAIILAPHKSLYVPFLGYMSEESIDEWADLVLKGKGRKIPLETIPRVEEDAQVPDTRDSDEKPPQDEL